MLFHTGAGRCAPDGEMLGQVGGVLGTARRVRGAGGGYMTVLRECWTHAVGWSCREWRREQSYLVKSVIRFVDRTRLYSLGKC